jgi:hypothetical protein
MSSQDQRIIRSATQFCGKFGFLTQDVFFEFLCQRSRSRKYSNWSRLLESGLFNQSKSNSKILYLSKMGFARVGSRAVKSRSPFFIRHDTYVAKVLLELEKTKCVLRSWTEAELRTDPWQTLEILGSKNIDKLPDLVVDLQGSNGFVRVAVEIEASRKSKEKYQRISLAYLGLTRINLVVFICEDRTLEDLIRRLFSSPVYLKAEKSPVTLLLEDFEKDRLQSTVRLQDRNFKFLDLLSRALHLQLSLETTTRDTLEKPVSGKKPTDLKSA